MGAKFEKVARAFRGIVNKRWIHYTFQIERAIFTLSRGSLIKGEEWRETDMRGEEQRERESEGEGKGRFRKAWLQSNSPSISARFMVTDGDDTFSPPLPIEYARRASLEIYIYAQTPRITAKRFTDCPARI